MTPKRPRSKNASIAGALRYCVTSLELPTNKAYAEAAGVTQSQVSHYLSGKVQPRDRTLERLVQPFGLTVEEFKWFAALLDVQRTSRLVILTIDEETGELRLWGMEPSPALVGLLKDLVWRLEKEV